MYELRHHGIKGMKWGVRRFQNKDGSLTAAGKKRARTKDSFNTNYRHTMEDASGRLIESKPDGVTKRQHNKALRAARREGYAYTKTFKSQARVKDELSVMGNKYDSEIEKYKAEQTAAGKKRKVKQNARIYKQDYKEYIRTVKKASLDKTLKEGDIVRGRRNLEVMLTKSGYVWNKSGDKLGDMSPEDLVDALYYLNYGVIPD